jgi:hypothetical protein
MSLWMAPRRDMLTSLVHECSETHHPLLLGLSHALFPRLKRGHCEKGRKSYASPAPNDGLMARHT